MKSVSHAAAFAVLLALAPAAMAADPYYQGKRLTVLVNYAAGGPTDIESRVFARHIGKHIPGNPTVVVQNRPGGGGVTGSNYMAAAAPKDGTVIDEIPDEQP